MEENLISSSNRPLSSRQRSIPQKSIKNHENIPFSFEILSALLIRFINQLKKTGKSLNTMNAYRNDLTLFCEYLTEHQIIPSEFSINSQEKWILFLKENGKRSQASIRRALMSVRSFLHYLIAESVILNCPFLDSKSPKHPLTSLLTVSTEKFSTLSKVLQQKMLLGDTKSVRDYALILILGECGLKATEAANLTWGDIWTELEDLNDKKTDVAGCLRICGTNERLIPYSKELTLALENLKKIRKSMGLSIELNSKLFYGYLNVSRRTCKDYLHRHGIKFVIYEVCIDILGIPFNSESLRNHAILRWLNQGLEISRVAQLAGYNSIHSLERFLNCVDMKTKSNRKMKTRH